MGAIIALVFLLLILGSYFFVGLIWWKIVKKTGFHPALGLLMLVPLVNLVMLAVLAFREWPVREQLAKHSDSGITPQKSLPVSLIIAIVFCAALPMMLLFAAIAIPNILRARLVANEAAAQMVVKNISGAVEDYAKANNMAYPTEEASLKIETSYAGKTINGYTYSLNLRADGYEVVASPEKCGISGKNVFLAETGDKLSAKDCR